MYLNLKIRGNNDFKCYYYILFKIFCYVIWYGVIIFGLIKEGVVLEKLWENGYKDCSYV